MYPTDTPLINIHTSDKLITERYWSKGGYGIDYRQQVLHTLSETQYENFWDIVLDTWETEWNIIKAHYNETGEFLTYAEVVKAWNRVIYELV